MNNDCNFLNVTLTWLQQKFPEFLYDISNTYDPGPLIIYERPTDGIHTRGDWFASLNLHNGIVWFWHDAGGRYQWPLADPNLYSVLESYIKIQKTYVKNVKYVKS